MGGDVKQIHLKILVFWGATMCKLFTQIYMASYPSSLELSGAFYECSYTTNNCRIFVAMTRNVAQGFSLVLQSARAKPASSVWVAHGLGCGTPQCYRKEGLVCSDLPFSWDWLPSWRRSFIWLQYQVRNRTGYILVSGGNGLPICRGLRSVWSRNCWGSFENIYACVTSVTRK
jgi:hypothetical protein